MIDPLTPPDLDLRDFDWMPLQVVRLRDSGIVVVASAEAFRAAVLLWCAAWHQVPAASLPADEKMLCSLAGFGRDLKSWRAISSDALHGFIECSDGRLYHPVIAEKAIESGSKKRKQTTRTAAANAAHWGERTEQTGDPKQRRSKRLAAAKARGRHSAEQWESLVEFCGSKCVKCGADGAVVKDHIVPIYKDGSDSIENLQPLCEPCNGRKGSDTSDCRPDGWRRAVFRENEASKQGVFHEQNASSHGIQTIAERLQGTGQDRTGPEKTFPEPESKKGESDSPSKNLKLIGKGEEAPILIDETYQPSERAVEYAYSLGMKKAELDAEHRKFVTMSLASRAKSYNPDMSFKLFCDRWLEFKLKGNPDWKPEIAPTSAPEIDRSGWYIVVDGTQEHACWNAYNSEHHLRPLFMCKQIAPDGKVYDRACKCPTLFPPGYNDFGERIQTSSEEDAA